MESPDEVKRNNRSIERQIRDPLVERTMRIEMTLVL